MAKDKDEKQTGRSRSYADDFDMIGQVVAASPHLKRIVLDKLRFLRQAFNENAFDKANRQQKEVRNANKAKSGGK